MNSDEAVEVLDTSKLRLQIEALLADLRRFSTPPTSVYAELRELRAVNACPSDLKWPTWSSDGLGRHDLEKSARAAFERIEETTEEAAQHIDELTEIAQLAAEVAAGDYVVAAEAALKEVTALEQRCGDLMSQVRAAASEEEGRVTAERQADRQTGLSERVAARDMLISEHTVPFTRSPFDTGLWELNTTRDCDITYIGANTGSTTDDHTERFIPVAANLVFSGDIAACKRVMYAHLAKLAASRPPGLCRMRFVDPAAYGQSLGPFYELLRSGQLGGKAPACEEVQMNETFAECRSRVQTVNQQALRGVHRSIVEFNAANSRPEHYLYVTAFDVGVGWKPKQVEQLMQLAEIGPACGVYVIASFNNVTTKETAAALERLRQLPFTETVGEINVEPHGELTGQHRGTHLILDCVAETDEGALRSLLEGFVTAAAGALTPAVTSSDLAAVESDGSTASGITIPVGVGANETVTVEFSDNPVHGLVVGGTGSGKTTLLHTLIYEAARRYPPEELELWLLDLKEGVEFRQYVDEPDRPGLPQAKVVACASDPRFALSALEALVAEGQRRGNLFRPLGAVNIATYRRQTGKELPRVLCVIDECHLLLANTTYERAAWEALGWLAKEGRAFGIHLLLATQSLAGLGLHGGSQASVWRQISLRLALQCAPNDAELIFGERNRAAIGLSARGDAVLNADHGAPESNTRFQVAHIDDAEAAQIRADLTDRWGHDATQLAFMGDDLPVWVAPVDGCDGTPTVTLGRPLTLEPTIEIPVPDGQQVAVFGPTQGTSAVLSVAALELAATPGGESLCITTADPQRMLFIEQLAAASGTFVCTIDALLERFSDGRPPTAVIAFDLDRLRAPAGSKTADHPATRLLAAARDAQVTLFGSWGSAQAAAGQLGSVSVNRLPFDVQMSAAGAEYGPMRAQVTFSPTSGIFAEPELFIPWAQPQLQPTSDNGRELL